jgi:Cu/Ag efflux protein CusF
MKTTIACIIAASLAIPWTAAAQQSDSKVSVTTTKELGKVSEQVGTKVTATVQAIDPETRTVTLRGAQGERVEVVAGDEVRNFDQIEVGDQVEVHYTRGVVLQLVKGGGGVRARVENESATRAAKGEKPRGTVTREVLVVVDVLEVDRERQTITVQGPERVLELRVHDPEQLATIDVGDQVEATFTEATAISVKPAEAKRE